ncbi:formate dehydrogenase accessory sulfurtransferase FdhD [Flavobacteriaceae bacterium]|jgi:FdhD protein|nr:formate dehydrogenase accessory sulfurtransferase FdhD [Flavobacteriaceae bacterium]
MQTNTYEGLHIINKKQSITTDELVIEAPLQININTESYTVVMRTPGNDQDLVLGLLYAEDIYKKSLSIPYEIIEEKLNIPSIVNVTIAPSVLGKGYLNKRTLLSVSSCGICGKKQLEDIKVTGNTIEQKISFSSENLLNMFAPLQQHQETFKKTGGSHAAGIFNHHFKLLTIREDIGRHNAVDKCVGSLLQKQLLKSGMYLLVSGRVSYEIVSKAFLAKIPVIVAVSACSSMAVDFAKEFGICLIGFTRENKMTVYANPSSLEKK